MKDEQSPLVSILVPAYNVAAYLNHCLDSLLAQTYTNIEILVCDDASTDETAAVIAQYQDIRIKKYHNPRNLHYVRTCNRLFPLCQGEFITFQDSDDWSEPTRIEKQVRHLLANPEIGANAVNYQRVEADGSISERSAYPCEHSEIVAAMPDEFLVLANSLMIRKEVYERIGGYHEFFDRIGAEHLYWYYLITEKYKVANLPEQLCFYRRNPQSITAQSPRKNPSRLLILDIIKELVWQRKSTGTDCLEQNNKLQMAALLQKVLKTQKYLLTMATQLGWAKDYKSAFGLVMSAIFKNPLLGWSAYRLAFYYLRKIIFHRS